MKKATTMILALVTIAFAADPAFAGNGHGNSGNHNRNQSANWNSGNANRWNWNSNSHNWNGNNSNKKYWNDNQHKNYGNYSFRYQYVTPNTYYPYYYQPAPQRPIVVNSPVNIVTPAQATKIAKPETKPETKVEMGDTVRITSERIVDTGDGRATMRIGHATRKLEIVDWSDGYVIVKIPTIGYRSEKVVSIMVFNGPGKLANRIDAVLVRPSQFELQSQYSTSQR